MLHTGIILGNRSGKSIAGKLMYYKATMFECPGCHYLYSYLVLFKMHWGMECLICKRYKAHQFKPI